MTVESRPHPSTLTSLQDILASLASLEEEETRLSESLADILSNHEPVQSSLLRLRALAPQLEEIGAESGLLSSTIEATAQTAERVGGRVRTLDEEMRRVREAGERVSQVMELKVCMGLLAFQTFHGMTILPLRHLLRKYKMPSTLRIGKPQLDTAPARRPYLWRSLQVRSPSQLWSVSRLPRLPRYFISVTVAYGGVASPACSNAARLPGATT